MNHTQFEQVKTTNEYDERCTDSLVIREITFKAWDNHLFAHQLGKKKKIDTF